MSLLEYVLIWAIAFFVICQIANGIMNIMSAKFVRRQAILNAKLREEEARANFDQMEAINIKFDMIIEKMDESAINLKSLQDDVFDVIVYNAKENKKTFRGKYKPRKPKAIEHKEANDR